MVKPFQVCVYVEGGGDTKSCDLATECKIGFGALLEKATGGHRLKIVPCGGRSQAYRAFSIAVKQRKYDLAVLLVDSEDPVGARTPWAHLKARDDWEPLDAPAHLMVTCMEAWLVADHDALRTHFKNAFDAEKFPKWQKLWEVDRHTLLDKLKDATRQRKGGPYGKGPDSFKILKHVDPRKLEACPHAKALFDDLKKRLAEGHA